VTEVHVYKASPLDKAYSAILFGIYATAQVTPPVNSLLYTPPQLKQFFLGTIASTCPDIIVMNYAHWDRLLDHQRFRQILRLIDTLDLVSLNEAMRDEISRYLPVPWGFRHLPGKPSWRYLPRRPVAAHEIDAELLREDFYERHPSQVQLHEWKTYEQYDYTIAISENEADAIRLKTSATRVATVPFVGEPRQNTFIGDGPALFAAGANPFNLQGYWYFVKRVLPRVRTSAPSFQLDVTGACCKYVRADRGINLRGVVPNLNAVYENVRFVICPVFGGTGQQIKIVEAMEYGVPVIALRAAAESSPIQHGVNGLVANNADEFASHVIRLWNDRDLCKRMGEAAQATIAADAISARTSEAVERIIGPEIHSG
jgi:hypothetical protein